MIHFKDAVFLRDDEPKLAKLGVLSLEKNRIVHLKKASKELGQEVAPNGETRAAHNPRGSHELRVNRRYLLFEIFLASTLLEASRHSRSSARVCAS